MHTGHFVIRNIRTISSSKGPGRMVPTLEHTDALIKKIWNSGMQGTTNFTCNTTTIAQKVQSKYEILLTPNQKAKAPY